MVDACYYSRYRRNCPGSKRRSRKQLLYCRRSIVCSRCLRCRHWPHNIATPPSSTPSVPCSPKCVRPCWRVSRCPRKRGKRRLSRDTSRLASRPRFIPRCGACSTSPAQCCTPISGARCRRREVGTTNRTHLADFEQAIGARSALLMKVHASNYAIQGFTAMVPEKELAALAHARELPFVVDLGSGALVDLSHYRLPKEPTPQETLAHGADLVTFSGDKLLGGPQAGIIVGRDELVNKIKRNHLKRALRVDKMTLAALEAVLKLYRQPEKLAQHLPTLRLLTRPAADIEALCRRVEPAVMQAVRNAAHVSVVPCHSQIGSGALPVELLPSTALALAPLKRGRGEGTALKQLADAFRALPVPVIGTISDGALKFDLRCLENEREFVDQLAQLRLDAGRSGS